MGAGKTTLAKTLAGALRGTPLIEESARHPFIREFYREPNAYAIETELAFLLLHYHQIIREERAGIFTGSVVADFALERDYVFSKLTLKNSEDWSLFENAYTMLQKRLPPRDILIYLRAPVEFLAERMAERGRDYENMLPQSYLEAVNLALDTYFLKEYKGDMVVFYAPDLDASINPDYVTTVMSHLS